MGSSKLPVSKVSKTSVLKPGGDAQFIVHHADSALIRSARQSLAEWPASHYGYRIGEVRQSLDVLDEIISQLRSHAGIALYEICARYKDIGRTSRQAWAWWR